MIRSPLITVMVEAATKAARSLKRDFGEVEALLVSLKGPGDFVTVADRKAEEIIRDQLAKSRPGFGFVLEESGVIEGSDPAGQRWHVDPLDGTTNFLHGIPHAAISIGLERDGQIIAGIIMDFLKDELFVAERGKGAFLNNRRIRVTKRKHLPDALIGTGSPHIGKAGHELFQRELAGVMRGFLDVRRLGAAALDLAYVASGRLDGFWERDISSWDVAAGLCLLREAGGFVSAPDGREITLAGKISVVAGNEAVHPALLRVLREAS